MTVRGRRMREGRRMVTEKTAGGRRTTVGRGWNAGERG